MTRLYQIQEAVRARCQAIVAAHSEWPCRKGCDECCRRLAAVPRVSAAEWQAIAGAVESLPGALAEAVRERIRDSARAVRPVVCPLLDTASGTCLVYEARPVACRAYGFYAERESVLGCSRIEAAGAESPEVVWGDIIWGNHAGLEQDLGSLGPALPLPDWL